MKRTEYTVTVVADSSMDIPEYLQEIIDQLEKTNGIESATITQEGEAERDISEVSRILSELDDKEVERLQDAIDSYTEDADE